MTKIELYERVIEEVGIKNVHPLHKAMLEECCENVIDADKNNDFGDETLVNSCSNIFHSV